MPDMTKLLMIRCSEAAVPLFISGGVLGDGKIRLLRDQIFDIRHLHPKLERQDVGLIRYAQSSLV